MRGVGRSLLALAVGVALVVPVGLRPVGAAPAAPLSVGVERSVAIARPGNAQSEADVAWNGSMFFVVWQETPVAGGLSEVWGARVLPDGRVLDPDGILIGSSTDGNHHIRPKVAGGMNRFMVVWEVANEHTYSDLGASIVNADGTIRRRWGLSFTDNGQRFPDVAWNGRMFLAVWQDEPDPIDQDIYGARVLPSGLTLDGCSTDACPNGDDPGIAIAVGPGNQTAPVVAGTSTNIFEVGWTDDSDPNRTVVRTGAVAVNGLSLDTDGVALTQSPGAQSQPAVAMNGVNALWAWTDARSGEATDIRAATMRPGDASNWNPTTTPPAGVLVSGARNDQTSVDLARRSGHFVAVWTDLRSGGADVYASRVGAAGAVLDPRGVAIAAGPRQQRQPAIATSGSKVLVAYQRDVPAAPFGGIDRIHLRIIS